MSGEPACPRCGKELRRSSATSVTIRACLSCGGAFLDNTATSRLMSLLPDDTLALAEGFDQAARRDVDTAKAIACPVCSRPMNRVHVKAAGVDIDTCAAHGTFYDRRELVTVARACKRVRAPLAAGVGAAAVGAAGVAALATAPSSDASARNLDTDTVELAADVADAAIEAASEGIFDIAGEVIGGLFEALGSLSD